MRAEDAVGADGGLAPGGVGVEGDEDAGARKVGGLADQFGLPAGQGGAAGGEPGVPAGVGEGDRDGVERAFHDDGDRSLGECLAGPGQARTAGCPSCSWRTRGC